MNMNMNMNIIGPLAHSHSHENYKVNKVSLVATTLHSVIIGFGRRPRCFTGEPQTGVETCCFRVVFCLCGDVWW